jgi:ankyrin repeat protein
VRYLVEYDPDALRVARATDGSYPIHVALEHGASLAVVDLLVRNQNVDATGLTNNAGETPLHVACRSGDSYTTVLGMNDLLEIIEFLVNQNPELVSARDEDGSAPLHVACATSARLEIVRYLVECAPEALRVARATDGSYPIHVALEYGASLVVIDLLLHNQDPYTTGLTNNASETPLHVACRCGASFEIVQSVVNRSGDAVKSVTSEGDLPLFLACGAAEPSLDTILTLMKGYPDVVKRSSPKS